MKRAFTPSRAHASLGPRFFDEVLPATFPRARLVFRNQRWAERVGLGGLDDAAWAAHFARFEPLEGSFERPLALRYHGHQFGVYNAALGDGRGFLFAQLAANGLFDLGTKGSGQTPYSRGGDGKLTLKGGVREVIATEMLEALGVKTSKTFSLFETGEMLFRGDEPSPTRSSVLVRLSHSHVRFGTFERLAREGDRASMVKLVDHVASHYYPAAASRADVPRALFGAIVEATAELAASFEIAGFVHGVLNTDNMNVTGEAFDFGPYRFIGPFDRKFTAAYFDHTGLYAFGRQRETFAWNLARLADALALVEPNARFDAELASYDGRYDAARARRFVRRLGVVTRGHDEDARLADLATTFLEGNDLFLERFYFDWTAGGASERRALEGPSRSAYRGPAFDAFRGALEAYAPVCASMIRTPYFERDAPASAHIDVIEEVWRAIDKMDDWEPFDRLVSTIREMGAECASADPLSERTPYRQER